MIDTEPQIQSSSIENTKQVKLQNSHTKADHFQASENQKQRKSWKKQYRWGKTKKNKNKTKNLFLEEKGKELQQTSHQETSKQEENVMKYLKC